MSNQLEVTVIEFSAHHFQLITHHSSLMPGGADQTDEASQKRIKQMGCFAFALHPSSARHPAA
jgi:hypothetical protein